MIIVVPQGQGAMYQRGLRTDVFLRDAMFAPNRAPKSGPPAKYRAVYPCVWD